LVWCARAGREAEYIALTQDTTEADLKQRRELVPGASAAWACDSGGTQMWLTLTAVSVGLLGRRFHRWLCGVLRLGHAAGELMSPPAVQYLA
jgi:hypothetical protein